jgi:hypothetical protein
LPPALARHSMLLICSLPHQYTSILSALTSRTIARALHAHYTTTPLLHCTFCVPSLFSSLPPLVKPNHPTGANHTTTPPQSLRLPSRLSTLPSLCSISQPNNHNPHDHDGTTALLPPVFSSVAPTSSTQPSPPTNPPCKFLPATPPPCNSTVHLYPCHSS